MAMPQVRLGYRCLRIDQQGLQAGVIGAQPVRLELHDMPALGERPEAALPAARAGVDVTGLDIDPDLIAQARASYCRRLVSTVRSLECRAITLSGRFV
jgi:hypothetical protein